MAGWFLVISRDSELTRSLARTLIRNNDRRHLWAVGGAEQARRELASRKSLPTSILIDELFLRGESLTTVSEEMAWYAPLILVARPERQGQAARLVSEGKADFVPRGEHFIPLACALVERTLRWERETEEQIRLLEQFAMEREFHRAREIDRDHFPAEALRMVGAMLDHLELLLGERSHLPEGVGRRLGRVADIAFDLKKALNRRAGFADCENAAGTETASLR